MVLTRRMAERNIGAYPMNINLNNQYAVLRATAYDLNQVAKTQSRSITQLAAGSQTADPTSAGVEAGSVLRLRNSGLRLRALETGVSNALSFLETQAGVFQRMADVVSRMSQLGSQMVDPSKSSEDVNNYFEEVSKLQEELSSYRMAQFNGRNLMNYLNGDLVEGTLGTAPETLSVALSEQGDSVLNITQSDLSSPAGPFNVLLGQITAVTSPGTDSSGYADETADAALLVDEAQYGQKGFDVIIQDIAQRMAVNQTEQSQLRLNLDRIRERMLGTEAATSRVADVDVAKELAVLTRTDIQFRGAIATKTQSNVLADSVLQILSNQDFSSPLIREARMSAASTRSRVG
jgi:flagellin-like hook-associated protein FlgL